jgi:creatinine amidohydrolase
MAIRKLADLTWEEAHDLGRGEAIAILPVGAIEAHGPHLPLATDIVIANAMVDAAAAELEDHGQQVVVLPPICYTTAGFAAGFAGTISVSPETVTGTIVDIARSVTKHGFAILAIANAHFDPDHLQTLHTAVRECRAAGARVSFPDITRKPWVLRLTEEFQSGACHAGQYECSIMMAAEPGLVLDDRRRALEPNPVSLSTGIRSGQTTFEEVGGPAAYFGDPAAASEEEGRSTISVLGSILVEAIKQEIGRADAT